MNISHELRTPLAVLLGSLQLQKGMVEEIEELAGRVKTAAGQTKLLFVLFNNHWQGYAPRNAADMMRSLQLPFKELPMQAGMEEEKTSESVDQGHAD